MCCAHSQTTCVSARAPSLEPYLLFTARISSLTVAISYLTLSGSLEAGLSTSVAKQKLEYEVRSRPSRCCLSQTLLQDTPSDGSAPRRRAFELKEIYGCDMLKPTECVRSAAAHSPPPPPPSPVLKSRALLLSLLSLDASFACPPPATPPFYRAVIFACARSARFVLPSYPSSYPPPSTHARTVQLRCRLPVTSAPCAGSPSRAS